MQHLLASARNMRLAYDHVEDKLEPEIELVLTLHDRRLQFVGAGIINVDQTETVRLGLLPSDARSLAANLNEWADEIDEIAKATRFTPKVQP